MMVHFIVLCKPVDELSTVANDQYVLTIGLLNTNEDANHIHCEKLLEMSNY